MNVRTDRSGHWLEHSILHLVEEAASDRTGSDAMLAKLSEALFVDTLRRYVTGLPDQTTGWLAGARDPVVGKSLALLRPTLATSLKRRSIEPSSAHSECRRPGTAPKQESSELAGIAEVTSVIHVTGAVRR